MPVRYLSQEWVDAYNAALAGDNAVRTALKGTISQSYETSAQVNKGELDGQKAFMQGKVKIAGKMLKMMQLRGPLEKVQTALNTIDTEY